MSSHPTPKLNSIIRALTFVPRYIVSFYKSRFFSLSVDDRVLLMLTVTAIVFVGVFIPIRIIQERVGMAAVNSIIVAVMALVHGLILARYTVSARRIFVGFTSLIMIVVIDQSGEDQLNWLFPASAMLFFSMKPHPALYTNLVVVSIIGAMLWNVLTLSAWLQNIVSLYCSVSIVYIFSYLLHRHNKELSSAANMQSELAALHQENSRLHRQAAYLDFLTGIPNRRAFNTDVSVMAKECAQSKRSACLILIDIDHFKTVNDTYGHKIGDDVLTQTAQVLKSSLRDGEKVYRLGGEEFAVLLPVGEAQGSGCAVRLKQAVEGTCFTSIPDIVDKQYCTISLGLATFDGGTPQSWYERADQALYKSKRNGRNRLSVSK